MNQHKWQAKRQKNTYVLLILFALLLLLSCGNPNLDKDSASPSSIESATGVDTTSTANSGYSIRLVLLKALDSQPTSTISSSSPGKLVATIINDKGQPVSEVLVSFSSDFAIFSPASATALSSINGQASILLLPGAVPGAGAVTATFVYQEETITAKLNFKVASADSTSSNQLSVALQTEDDTLTTAISADLPGKLTVSLTDSNGVGISGVVVQVQGTLATFVPGNGTVVTDNNGIAIVKIIAGDKTGADTLSLTASTTNEILTSLLVYQVNPPALQFGNGDGSDFLSGKLSISSTTLAASATTSVNVDILDANDLAFNTPIEVSFTSNCVLAGSSVIDEKVMTVNGRAVATYEAKGCEGEDLITAVARYGGAEFSAVGTVTIASDTAGFIEFISAIPEVIAIIGTGGAGLSETATVTFRVRGKLGGALSNQLVDFTLNTNVGGITVTPSSKTTNASGEVTTIVKSGSIGTSVRVTATVNSTNISTQSNQLTVSTGVPDQNSISLSYSVHNPEAFVYDGEEAIISARLADRSNNPVPDGTAVYFTTEGGSIQPSCTTLGGLCTVVWTSQFPRPVDHRVTILAVAIGEESFYDEDGNGLFSDKDGEPFSDLGNGFFDESFSDQNTNDLFDEPFTDSNGNGTYTFGESFVDYNDNGRYDGEGNNPAGELTFVDANGNGAYDGSGVVASGDAFTDITDIGTFNGPGFVDLPEAYLDVNENEQRDLGEPYLDFNFNGFYDIRDGEYNGVLCSHSTICSTDRSLHVRKSVVIIMSGSRAFIVVQDAATGAIYASNHPSVTTTASLNVSGGSARLRITIMDSAGQVMPVGTVVTVGADVGEIAGDVEFTVTNSTAEGGSTLNATISDDDTTLGDRGILTIDVTTPKEHITSINIDLRV